MAMGSAAWGQVQLVTVEEARLPEGSNLATRAITRGPGVQLASPVDVNAQSFPLDVRLEPRGGARIDTASVKVEYLKNPPVDVTSRLQGSLREDGITAAAVRVPPGQHRFRVSVRDSEGRAGAAVFEIRAR